MPLNLGRVAVDLFIESQLQATSDHLAIDSISAALPV